MPVNWEIQFDWRHGAPSTSDPKTAAIRLTINYSDLHVLTCDIIASNPHCVYGPYKLTDGLSLIFRGLTVSWLRPRLALGVNYIRQSASQLGDLAARKRLMQELHPEGSEFSIRHTIDGLCNWLRATLNPPE